MQQYLPSILIGITQVPSDGITSPKSLEKVRNNFADYPLLHKVDDQDNPNIFTFDLWDETIPGGLDRSRILARLAELKPIKNTQWVFGSVLLASDEQRLREISDALSKEIEHTLATNGGADIKTILAQAVRLNSIDHPYTKGIIDKLHEQLQTELQKQKETIKTLFMNRTFDEPEKLLANMEAMQQHLAEVKGCEKVSALYTATQDHITQAKEHSASLERIDSDLADKKESLTSLQRALKEGWFTQASAAEKEEEMKNLDAAITDLKAERNLTEIKMILGTNYVGEEAWAKLDIIVSPKDLPAITDDLISRVKAMQTKGEQPIFVLDLGKSIKAMEALCQSKDITAFSTEYGGDEKLRGEDCYTTAGPEGARWLLLPGSDHGVLPGSRMKAYEEQVQHMEANYPGYEVGGARELVTLAMLKYLQDGTVLFGTTGSAYGTYARCKEQFQKAGGGWDGYQIGLGGNEENGSSGVSGLVVDCVHFYDPQGLLCVLSGVPALLKNT